MRAIWMCFSVNDGNQKKALRESGLHTFRSVLSFTLKRKCPQTFNQCVVVSNNFPFKHGKSQQFTYQNLIIVSSLNWSQSMLDLWNFLKLCPLSSVQKSAFFPFDDNAIVQVHHGDFDTWHLFDNELNSFHFAIVCNCPKLDQIVRKAHSARKCVSSFI